MTRQVQKFKVKFNEKKSKNSFLAAIFSLKIRRFLEHLVQNRHDQSMIRSLQLYMDKRTKILKYLRRKNLPRFVQTCELIGVDPNAIRA